MTAYAIVVRYLKLRVDGEPTSTIVNADLVTTGSYDPEIAPAHRVAAFNHVFRTEIDTVRKFLETNGVSKPDIDAVDDPFVLGADTDPPWPDKTSPKHKFQDVSAPLLKTDGTALAVRGNGVSVVVEYCGARVLT